MPQTLDTITEFNDKTIPFYHYNNLPALCNKALLKKRELTMEEDKNLHVKTKKYQNRLFFTIGAAWY